MEARGGRARRARVRRAARRRGGSGRGAHGLTIAFFAAIAFLAYRLFRQYRFELESLPDRQRLALYGSLGLALVTFTATNRLFDAGGLGVLAWFALLGLASYGLYWVWTQYRSYG